MSTSKSRRSASLPGNGRVKVKLEPTKVTLSSEDGAGSGSLSLEMKPTDVQFSSSEVSSESAHAAPIEAPIMHEPRERNASFARLFQQRRMDANEKQFVLAALRHAYTVPSNYNGFRDSLADAAASTHEAFSDAIRSGSSVIDATIFKAWTALEYLLNNDDRDPREIIVEYSDAISDALTQALQKYNTSDHDGDDVPDSAPDTITESYLAPFKDAPALRTALFGDDEEKRQTKISEQSGKKIVTAIKRALATLQPTNLKKPDVIVEQAPFLPKSQLQIGWEMRLMTTTRDVLVSAAFVVRRFSDKTYVVNLIAREQRTGSGIDGIRPHTQDFKAADLSRVSRCVREALMYVAQLVGRTPGAKAKRPKVVTPVKAKPAAKPVKKIKVAPRTQPKSTKKKRAA